MPGITSVSDLFGFHSAKTVTPEENDSDDTKQGKARTLNAMNIIGYIPIFGIISGIIRFWLAFRHADNAECKVALITRAIVEIVGAGLLFAIPDLIVSIGRHKLGYCLPESKV